MARKRKPARHKQKHPKTNSLDDIAKAIASEHLAIDKDIKETHDLINARALTTLQRARKVGQLLLEAKGQLKHGEFLPWVEKHCDISVRRAQCYMKIAERWTLIEPHKGHLTIETAAAFLR